MATLKRSGTHILIDLLLNNFVVYRKKPLYIDLEKCFAAGVSAKAIQSAGGVVIKTHYPQNFGNCLPFGSYVREVAQDAIVLTTSRDLESIAKSLADWDGSTENLVDTYQSFIDFWHSYSPLNLEFDRMVDQDNCRHVIVELASRLGCPYPSTFVLPPKRTQKYRTYAAKLMTRLLGRKAPVINTTIRFAKTG